MSYEMQPEIAPWLTSSRVPLKIIESSDYAECKDVIDRKDIGEVEQGVEAKFEAARVKAGSQ
jgi:hypothetical protein